MVSAGLACDADPEPGAFRSDDALAADDELALDDALDDELAPGDELAPDDEPCEHEASASEPPLRPEDLGLVIVQTEGELGSADASAVDELTPDMPVSKDCGDFVWREHTFAKTNCGTCGAEKRVYGKFSGVAISYVCPGGGACCYQWWGTPNYTEWCSYC